MEALYFPTLSVDVVGFPHITIAEAVAASLFSVDNTLLMGGGYSW